VIRGVVRRELGRDPGPWAVIPSGLELSKIPCPGPGLRSYGLRRAQFRRRSGGVFAVEDPAPSAGGASPHHAASRPSGADRPPPWVSRRFTPVRVRRTLALALPYDALGQSAHAGQDDARAHCTCVRRKWVQCQRVYRSARRHRSASGEAPARCQAARLLSGQPSDSMISTETSVSPW